jgi:hypothetical protein
MSSITLIETLFAIKIIKNTKSIAMIAFTMLKVAANSKMTIATMEVILIAIATVEYSNYFFKSQLQFN